MISSFVKHIGLTAAASVIVFTFAAAANAQDAPPQKAPAPPMSKGNPERGSFLMHLGLTAEQWADVKALYAKQKPVLQAAQHRLREATKSLDEAIYADTLNEPDVQQKLKETQEAQAEVARIRNISEVSIRKILTPEQLIRFRDLRKQFEGMRRPAARPRMPKNRMAPGRPGGTDSREAPPMQHPRTN
ncbi:MAG: periplasmic heavy metal sensor [Chloracidobacterium sp.]|nr:periplasmic heavy metal sensor [Chloracidobacterium sp.]MCC6824360.1 periplasmic heavy metal sensor [Acidobacteriota bacterium]MCO5332630.1 periplasmic heavy metal sensor [Pyrinomonadaceae bacterium]